MGVRILSTSDDVSVMYDSVTDWAFGPVFYDTDTHCGSERLEAFLDWLPQDARKYSESELAAKYHEWLKQEEEYWKVKRDADSD